MPHTRQCDSPSNTFCVGQHCPTQGNTAYHLAALPFLKQYCLSLGNILSARQHCPWSGNIAFLTASFIFRQHRHIAFGGQYCFAIMPPSTTESDEAGDRATGSESKRQKRNKAANKSKQRAKSFNPGQPIKWGIYDLPSATSGSAGESELLDFIRRLDAIATYAETRRNTTAHLLAGLRPSLKLDILVQLESALPNLPDDDVILLTNAQSLEHALARRFSIPLLHRATTNPPSLAPSTDFGIDDLCRHLADDRDASMSVYDYRIDEPERRTRPTKVNELLSCFLPGTVAKTALNFLDIENRTKIQFSPPQLVLQDVSTKLEARLQHNKGKVESEWKTEPWKEFFIISLRHSISTIHVDTGGAVTWVLILEGRKIWYFPRHVTAAAGYHLGLAGSQRPEDYEGGWVKVELLPGDLL